jgi:tight adherence protein C
LAGNTLWEAPLAAAALIGSGALLVSQAVLARRRRLAERIALVAPDAPPESAQEKRLDTGLLKAMSQNGREAEIVTVARLCGRLGLPGRRAPQVLRAIRLVLAAAFGSVALAGFHAGGAAVTNALPLHLTLVLIGTAAGWFAPALWLRQATAARIRTVSAGLPDALELLVVCVEAGLALEDALERVTVELKLSQPALAEELAVTAADLKVLPDRNQAFTNLAERVGTPAIRSVVTTLAQTLRYGTPLASALRLAADELRSDAILDLEERAGRLPALMTVPLLVFILPTIFIVVGGPAILRLMDLLGHGG